MQRYDLVRILGEGKFGTVYLARSRTDSSREFAIKRIHERKHTWQATMDMDEIKALRAFKGFPHVVQLKELVRERDGTVYICMQLEDGNLLQLLAKVESMDEPTCAELVRQTLAGLASLHRLGYVHRDVKPENILVSSCGRNGSGFSFKVSIGDLGSACLVHKNEPLFTYVTTRFYRAPEVVFQADKFGYYGSAIDMWAVGCVAFEVLAGRILFPARTVQDLKLKFCAILGSPPAELSWGHDLPAHLPKRPLRLAFRRTKHPDPSEACVRMIEACVQWQPCQRPSCDEALNGQSFLRVDN